MTTAGGGFNQEPYHLPEGWAWVTLGELAEIRNGVTKGRDLSGFETVDVPYLRVANVQNGYLNLYEVKSIQIKSGELEKYQLRPNDILFTEGGDRDKLGRGTVWHGEIEPCIHQNHIHCARLRDSNVEAKWISLVSQLPYARDYFWNVASQTVNLASLNASSLKTLPIPLPPVMEQKRILEKIDKVIGQIRSTRHTLECIPSLLKAFRQSVLAAAFRGDLTEREAGDEPAEKLLERIRAERRRKWENGLRARGKDPAKFVYPEPPTPDTSDLPELPEEWLWSRIGTAFDVSLGGTPARDKPEYWNGRVPWVSSGEVAFCHIGGTKEMITNLGLSKSNAKYNPAGSVLLAMIGEGKTRGQAAILDIPATTNQNIAAINVATTPIKPEWLFYWFMYQYEDVRGGGVGGAQPALNAGRIKELVFPIAPKEEQERIIGKLVEVDRYVESIETTVQAASRQLDALEQKALARAFRGVL